MRPTHDVIAAELRSHLARHGKVTPAAVIDEARAPSAPLHGAFTWDDTIAARQHRLREARVLIRSVRVITDDGADAGAMYVNVRTADDIHAGYLLVADVVREPTLFVAAMRNLIAKLRGAQRAITDLRRAAEQTDQAELSTVEHHITSAVSSLESYSPPHG